MHYVFEKDGMRTVVPCTRATMSRVHRAYRKYDFVEFDPKVLGITLANPRRRALARVEPQLAIAGETRDDTVRVIVALVLILILSGIAGGIECGTIPFF